MDLAKQAEIGLLNPTRSSSGLLLQRQCACGNHSASRECEGCEKQRTVFRRKSTGSPEPSPIPFIVDDVLSSPGQPLDAANRAFFEPRFHQDFSRAQIHTDSRPAESAAAVNALAYTVGHDLVFGAAQYDPGTDAGKRLIAHELAHTLQQDGTVSDAPAKISEPAGPPEREADKLADQVMAG